MGSSSLCDDLENLCFSHDQENDEGLLLVNCMNSLDEVVEEWNIYVEYVPSDQSLSLADKPSSLK